MRTRSAAALAALALAVAGCSSGAGRAARPAAPDSSAPAGRFASYVALGDSYTAAPLVPTTDLADGCLRSDHNYPTLLAKRLHVRHFTDVSCSGATTGDLTHRQHTYRQASVPPQLRAVHRDTDLVTVGIGGNDFDLFGTLAFG
jgi:lysophospholipase L1-like esterase